jgi:exopolysaccharide biosynthesis polyprenyl glycosylphosphotransferase
VISERARLVTVAYVVADAVATTAAFVSAYLIRERLSLVWAPFGPIFPLRDYLPLLGLILPLWLLVFHASGMYGSRAARTLRTEVSRLLRALAVAALLLFFVIFAAKLDYVSRPVILLFLFLNAISTEAFRGVVRGVVLDSTIRRRIVVAGGYHAVQRVAATVNDHRDWGLDVIALATDGTWSTESSLGHPVLGTYDDIPARVAAGEIVDEVLIAPASDRTDDLRRIESVLLHLEQLGIVTRLVVNFLPTRLPHLDFDEFGGLSLMTMGTKPRDEVLLFVRRIADLGLSALLLVVLSPLFGVIALAIGVSSPGAILFRQIRCGLHGRPFVFLKFRTMREDAEAMKPALAEFNEMDGPVFKMTNDPRIVNRLGHFLRRTSLDELPQLWNILRGDMSFVGPRPAVLDEVREYEPWQRRRLSMPPGLTCLWQISGRNNLTFAEWMRLDLEYIDNWSLWLDLKIALKTIPAVLLGRGAK